MAALILPLLASAAFAAPPPKYSHAPTYSSPSTPSHTPSAPPQAIPLRYAYSGSLKFEVDIEWGSPKQSAISTVFDIGSSSFWVFGPNTTLNSGSQFLGGGPCNSTATSFYNWPASKTHSKRKAQVGAYSYGGAKFVDSSYVINDTVGFANSNWPGLANNQVGLAYYESLVEGDASCDIGESAFDESILGMAPVSSFSAVAGSPPYFRDNLYNQGKTKSKVFSVWFDEPPKDVKGTYHGTSLFGAVPENKYKGELVRVPLDPPTGPYVGYYVKLPKFSAKSAYHPDGPTKTAAASNAAVTNCLIDSGNTQDYLPINQTQVLAASGLILVSNPDAYFVGWNGSCESIPETATLDYTFAGSTAGKDVTVKVPIRNYVKQSLTGYPPADNDKVCPLSVQFDYPGNCVFGAPFLSAAFMAFDDDNKEIAMAQGGVSTGALNGPSSLGEYKIIERGQHVPGSV